MMHFKFQILRKQLNIRKSSGKNIARSRQLSGAQIDLAIKQKTFRQKLNICGNLWGKRRE